MQLTVKGRHVRVSDRLREHVRERLDSAISKYFTTAIDAHVVFESGKRNFETQITVHVGSGITLQGQGEADEIFACFDIAAARVEKRLRRYKRRLRDHHRGRSRSVDVAAVFAQQYVIAAESELEHDDESAEPEGLSPVIVAETSTEIAELTVSEAVMRMDLAELPVLIFFNRSHGAMNVVYRRPDGNIGWIDPQISTAE
ncbi:MAG: ribosome-associated translation inhibitor RaiA [Proteobacteria bacterium]|nr:ribosome-associated translation inhibitor RaiA [Pseudomonadota bacterium]MDA1356060.1 ribosome-associated translation inhibitor RaiA [Pseudomonadota bacterium]